MARRDAAKNAARAEPDSSATTSSARSWRCTATMSRHSHAVVSRHRCADRRRSVSDTCAATSSRRAAKTQSLREVVRSPVREQGGIQRVGRDFGHCRLGGQTLSVVRERHRACRIAAVDPRSRERGRESAPRRDRLGDARTPRRAARGSGPGTHRSVGWSAWPARQRPSLSPSPAARASANAATNAARMASTSPATRAASAAAMWSAASAARGSAAPSITRIVRPASGSLRAQQLHRRAVTRDLLAVPVAGAVHRELRRWRRRRRRPGTAPGNTTTRRLGPTPPPPPARNRSRSRRSGSEAPDPGSDDRPCARRRRPRRLGTGDATAAS